MVVTQERPGTAVQGVDGSASWSVVGVLLAAAGLCLGWRWLVLVGGLGAAYVIAAWLSSFDSRSVVESV
jgi:hypothetical protein